MDDERHPEGATPTRGRAFGASRRTRSLRPRSLRRVLGWVLSGVLVALLLVHAFVAETFTVPSRSMQPSYQVGDRIVVDKLHDHPRRGDVIVFSGADVFYEQTPRDGVLGALDTAAGWLGFRPNDQDYLKRVIGVGGDTVSVGHDGRLRVDGRVVDEPYLPQGQRRASAEPFNARVTRCTTTSGGSTPRSRVASACACSTPVSESGTSASRMPRAIASAPASSAAVAATLPTLSPCRTSSNSCNAIVNSCR